MARAQAIRRGMAGTPTESTVLIHPGYGMPTWIHLESRTSLSLAKDCSACPQTAQTDSRAWASGSGGRLPGQPVAKQWRGRRCIRGRFTEYRGHVGMVALLPAQFSIYPIPMHAPITAGKDAGQVQRNPSAARCGKHEGQTFHHCGTDSGAHGNFLAAVTPLASATAAGAAIRFAY